MLNTKLLDRVIEDLQNLRLQRKALYTEMDHTSDESSALYYEAEIHISKKAGGDEVWMTVCVHSKRSIVSDYLALHHAGRFGRVTEVVRDHVRSRGGKVNGIWEMRIPDGFNGVMQMHEWRL